MTDHPDGPPLKQSTPLSPKSRKTGSTRSGWPDFRQAVQLSTEFLHEAFANEQSSEILPSPKPTTNSPPQSSPRHWDSVSSSSLTDSTKTVPIYPPLKSPKGAGTISVDQMSFTEGDNPSVIMFTESGSVKAGTFCKLVEKLTSQENSLDIDDFLLTYRSFCKPVELAEALRVRYDSVTGDHKTVRLKVLNVIRKWVEKYWYDLAEDTAAQNILLEFLESISEGNLSSGVALAVKAKLTAHIENSPSLSEVITISKQETPKKTINISQYPHIEVAKHLTLIEWSIWVNIKQWELLGLAWTKPDRNERAPHGITPPPRVNHKKHAQHVFPSITWDSAHIARQLGNFNGVLEFFSAFQRGPVARMKRTYQAVMSPKILKIFKELEFLTDRTKNFANMRNAIKNVNPPVIPYLGMYLTDLLFIDEGSQDYITSPQTAPPGLINFFKCRQCSETIKRIKQYQLLGYSIQPKEDLLNALKNLNIIEDENLLYDLSNYLEPRGGGDPGPKPPNLVPYLTNSQELERARSKLKIGIPKKLQATQTEEIGIKKDAIIDPESGELWLATIPKIVEHLTPNIKSSMDGGNFVLPFLSVYREWATPEELLSILIERFSPPEPKTTPEDLKRHYLDIAQPIQIRVANFIKLWLDHYWLDFEHSSELFKTLQDWIRQHSASFTVGVNLQGTLGPVIQKKLNPPSVVCFESILPQIPFDLRDDTALPLDALDPIEVARQMTLEAYFRISLPIGISDLIKETENAFALMRTMAIDTNIGDFQVVADMIQSKITGIEGFDVQDRKRAYGKVYKDSFVASEAVSWLMNHLAVSLDLAIKYGRLFQSKNIIENLTGESEFSNNDHLFKFVAYTSPTTEMRVFNFTPSVHITRTRGNILTHLAWIKRFVLQEVNHAKAVTQTPWTTLRQFIKVAQELKNLNNWHSLLGVIGGLQQFVSPENKCLWDNLPHEDRMWFTSTRAIFLNPMEFKNTIFSLPNGSIPCVQIFLDSVTQSSTVFEEPLHPKTGLINVFRLIEIGQIVHQFSRIQQKTPPPFHPQKEIQSYLDLSRGTTRKL